MNTSAYRGLAKYGAQLLEKGYQIVPIKPNTKSPQIKNWQALEADAEMLSSWLSNGHAKDGVGVLCAHTPCVDIDVTHADVVHDVIEAVRKQVGCAPLRTGNAPKCAMYFRTDTPFTKCCSKSFLDEDERVQRLEILGKGQQSVLYAIHPDTGKPYAWDSEADEIARIAQQDLPELTQEQAEALCEWFNDYASERGWWEKDSGTPSKTAIDTEADILAHYKPPLGNAEDRKRLDDALFDLDADCGYQDWVTVGMGLYHEYEGSEEGFEKWLAWSKTGAKFDGTSGQQMRKKWRTFREDYRRDGVTARSILRMAKAETSEDIMVEFLSRYVFITDGERVADLHEPPHACIRRWNEFKNETADRTIEVPAPTDKQPKRMKTVKAWEAWQTNEKRMRVRAPGYLPHAGRVYTDELGVPRLNMFYAPDWSGRMDSKTAATDVALFEKHMRILIPDDIDRRWFIGWTALPIQRPQQRCHVVPFHINTIEGAGRGWVLRLLERIIGAHNVNRVEMHDFIDSDFNGFLSECLVCAVEEAKESNLKYQITERIKEKVEAPRLMINRKYGAKAMERIFANVVIFSNHWDAVSMDEKNRRIYVIAGPEEKAPDSHYQEIYAALNRDSFVANIYQYLHDYDLSGLDFFTPRWDNAARQRLIAASRSDTEQAFWVAFQDPDNAVCQYADFEDSARKYFDEFDDPFEFNEKQCKALFKKHAGEKKKVRLGSGRGTPTKWVFVLDKSIDWRELARKKYE